MQLELPETGVCNSNPTNGSAEGVGCCGTSQASDVNRGLATGVSGGLIALPLATIGSASQGGSCCG